MERRGVEFYPGFIINMIKGIIIGFTCFLIFLSHVVIGHKINIKRHFHFMSGVFFLGILVYAILFIAVPADQIQRFISALLPLSLLAFANGAFIYIFLCVLYLYLLQITDRSAAVRIAVEIEKSPEKQLTMEQIKRLYDIDDKIYNGLEDMAALGRLKKDGKYYMLTPKGRMHIRIFKPIRDYLRLTRN